MDKKKHIGRMLIDKLLIANRGEIALRIIRSAKSLGIKTVAMYLESEKESKYVALADECVCLGSDDLESTFLNISRIIDIALSTGSTAIHPGYGFLSENANFAKTCEEHQIIFVGPNSDVLSLMGNKSEAKSVASALGIPVISGIDIDLHNTNTFEQIEFPAILKAAFGGGGKGMKIVENLEELTTQVERSARIALSYFGNGSLFVEHYLRNARHVEVQILGDHHGNVIHLYERECSIQRNHQKIIEEAPAAFLPSELRNNLLIAAINIGKALHYTGAGTIEFLVDDSGNYFFMEMNPRIQVEHAVTEQITGIDIVAEQLKIASGFPISYLQEQIIVNGHASEARIYAENPAFGFIPSSSPLQMVNFPKNKHLRIEADLQLNQSELNLFDPLLFKMIAWGDDRKSSLDLLARCIQELNIIGTETNTKYVETILKHPLFKQNRISIEFCNENHAELIKCSAGNSLPTEIPFLIAMAIAKKHLLSGDNASNNPWQYTGYWRLTSRNLNIMVNDQIHTVRFFANDRSSPSFSLNGSRINFQIENYTEKTMDVTIDSQTNRLFYRSSKQDWMIVGWKNSQYKISFPDVIKNTVKAGSGPIQPFIPAISEITSPLHGRILEIFIKENQHIKKGDPVLLIEAMKSENQILSHKDAKVKKIAVNVGAQVTDRMPLIFLED